MNRRRRLTSAQRAVQRESAGSLAYAVLDAAIDGYRGPFLDAVLGDMEGYFALSWAPPR